MKTVCKENKCTGCMACVDICQHGAVAIEDSLMAYNAIIDPTKCIGCKACERVCQINHTPVKKEPILWQQGWAADPETRKKSSSGGAAAVFEREFVRTGGYVCSCVFSGGHFVYRMYHTEEEIVQFAGSKYVKSDPSGIYPQVKEKLKQGDKVLFVGLPCHVAAVKNFVGLTLSERLYTIDLICHGTPSPQILMLFLKQHNMDIADVSNICFRKNTNFFLQCDHKPIETKNCLDKYSMGFLYSLFYTENCYECHYATTQRISDITIGDSWGSDLSADEQAKGISLIICQTEKGKQLLSNSKMLLHTVDKNKAVAANHQLKAPSSISPKRAYFFEKLESGVPMDRIIRRCYPKSSFKQFVKGILMKLKLKK